MLYCVSEGMSSGACSNRGKHVMVIVTKFAVSLCIEAYVLVRIIVYEYDVLSESSVI